ncbi:MAG: GNAT family N-acetyltransferase [Actinomycetota bacterium]
MATGLIIRPGRASDRDAIAAFTTETFDWGDYVPDEYLNWLDQPDGEALVAVDGNDSPVAVVHVRMMSGKEAWLSGARVHADHRRQGVGSQLNHYGVDWATRRGAAVIRLSTEENNYVAQAQVAKLGYRRIARFVMVSRSFATQGVESNGGRRLAGPERFDLAPAAEAEPGFMVWSVGSLARTGHGLYGADGWSFRRLTAADLVEAARQRSLWTCPSGWAVVDEDHHELWVSLLITTPDDAHRAVRALIDLAEEKGATRLMAMIPRVGWLETALIEERMELRHPHFVYEKVVPRPAIGER